MSHAFQVSQSGRKHLTLRLHPYCTENLNIRAGFIQLKSYKLNFAKMFVSCKGCRGMFYKSLKESKSLLFIIQLFRDWCGDESSTQSYHLSYGVSRLSIPIPRMVMSMSCSKTKFKNPLAPSSRSGTRDGHQDATKTYSPTLFKTIRVG